MIPVGRYLPGVIPAGGKIIIRELLQHRSGLANYTGYLSWTDPTRAEHRRLSGSSTRRVSRPPRPLLFAPGRQWAYSSANTSSLP
jgi:D-alanyl-D-alanine carboxypeptidase